ncbi:DUF6504 family protein [Aestuariimicrobium ganziense]|uniref:DUF6504 family protein n=1 Tax=Aestuariimicrobium ganziense TaxID=2773677 RepID=UPI001942E5A1|nr:DUF6504 family protein [Aestuariimicrobium ganziense]
MRRHHDPVQVRLGREEDPVQFVWREQLWRVLAVESRWIESGQWWTSPAVRAARGEELPEAENDLLCEIEVWRVEAANGMAGSRGIYELAHTWNDGAWQLRTVVD